ncbi:hypothetical protein UU9_12478 [Rhodanobacter fulvus Jip2]|jgi:hypothetical protein|uniref:Uncharacterized protein n=1 Tax=Rhodanobacter fulvus Jip2 TaxID=1163408 RepID=I4VMX4_9GAMM|nr:hypothetical protein [Rhodanobacter fulvus]EIL88565.1 hypothetical protein UU9_12478 [Rhodanobacter fulvus Jip2]
MERKTFLLIVQSPELQADHKDIVEAVRHHSLGDFIEVLKETSAPRGSRAQGTEIPFVVAYLFSTETPPSEMGFGLLRRDRYVLLQVGPATWVDGFSRVRDWLDRHRQESD